MYYKMKGYDFMKNIKRVFSLITVVMMVFCLNIFSVNVSASEYTITVKAPSSDNVSIAGQTFNAYKEIGRAHV